MGLLLITSRVKLSLKKLSLEKSWWIKWPLIWPLAQINGPIHLTLGNMEFGTTLIKLAFNALPSPKGIIYINVPMDDEGSKHFMKALQEAIGLLQAPYLMPQNVCLVVSWSLYLMLNGLADVGLSDVWTSFSTAASKCK